MFRKLLELKHWQIFVAIIGGPILFQIIMATTLIGAEDPRDVKYFFLIFPILMIWVAYFTFGWQWAIIKELRDKLPNSGNFPFKRIKAFLIIPVTYLLLVSVLMPMLMFEVFNHIGEPEPPDIIFTILPLMALIVPLHLFSIFCLFHTLYFVAKILKTVEERRNLTFSDFVGEFFLIWFFFIGVWILQPRVNRIVQGDFDDAPDVLDDIIIDDDEIA